MQKRYTFSEDEFDNILKEKDELRKQVENLKKKIHDLENQIEFTKTEKEDVLVIVKDKDKKDEYILKTKEKEVLKEMLSINRELVLKNEEYLTELHRINTDYNFLIKEKNDISEKLKLETEKVKNLENRNIIDRIFNKNNLNK